MYINTVTKLLSAKWWLTGKEPACQCRRHTRHRRQNLPAMREMWVWSLGWEDAMKEEMANQSSILAWKIPSTEETGRLQSKGLQKVGHDCWTVVLEKTLESPLDCKEIQLVHPKGDQSWVFIGGTDAEAETPILWPPHTKSWLIGKDPDAGKDWGQEEKGTTEDEMAGWHYQLNGHEFEWTPGVGDGQGGLACCNSWGHKESDMSEWLNWTEQVSMYAWSSYCYLLMRICFNSPFIVKIW